jgi:hypothetical protein
MAIRASPPRLPHQATGARMVISTIHPLVARDPAATRVLQVMAVGEAHTPAIPV